MTRLNIGDLGRHVEPLPEDVTFDWFGTDVRVNPDFGELTYLDWMEMHSTIDENDPRAIVAMKSLMRDLIHPDDFDGFWATTKRNRQGLEPLMRLMQVIVEQVSARPTGQPSVSSGGQQNTVANSAGDSSRRVIARMESAGRPDLAVIHDLAREAREGKEPLAV